VPVSVAAGATPVPDRLADDWDAPPAISLICKLVVRFPTAFGAKVTLTWQLPPGPRVCAAQPLLVIAKLPALPPERLTPGLAMVIAMEPVFEYVNTSGALVVPLCWDANA
jgi:hypothetical protein